MYTIESSLRIDAYPSVDNHAVILSKQDLSSPELGWVLKIDSTGYVHFNDLIKSSQPLSLNTWYHIAVVNNGNSLKLSISNGPLQDEKEKHNFDNLGATCATLRSLKTCPQVPLLVGAQVRGGVPCSYFQGSITDVRLWYPSTHLHIYTSTQLVR